MPEEYTFERVSRERLRDIQLLYHESFNENVSMEFLERKYDTAAFGADKIGFIAYDTSGNPAAYYGVFPCIAAIKGKNYLCAQSGDTMTHPQHRGKGLFITLAKLTYRLAEESGVKFVFGFPNDNSYHGFVKKLGWTHKENLNIYRIKVFTVPAAYLCSKVSFLNKAYRAYAAMILKGSAGKKSWFGNPLINETDSGLLRDEFFFEYKTYSEKFMVDAAGKAAYLKVSSALRVGDVESSNEEDFLKTLKKLKRIAWLLGCYAVIFYYSPGSRYDGYLSKIASPEKGAAIGWVDFGSGLELDMLKFAQIDLDTF